MTLSLTSFFGGGTTKARAQALVCCRDMERCFARVEFARARVTLDPAERLADATTRSSLAYGNASRLRGAFWCMVALRGALRADPSDREVEDFVSLLHTFLREEWSVPCSIGADEIERAGVCVQSWQRWASSAEVPDELTERTAIASLHVRLMSRFARAEPPPRQAALHDVGARP